MMNFKNCLQKIVVSCFLIAAGGLSAFSQAQAGREPRQEKLLNGMKMLVWSNPKAEKISIKIRIHSGSAFDPKDKMGVMATLADMLFPDPQTKVFIEEDLGGKLDVSSSYDYIQVSASGNPEDFLAIFETIATGIASPQLTQENFNTVREARAKLVAEAEKDPAYRADMAIAGRLYGEFPYGRPQIGTSESLKRIDRADMIFARDRFLLADNATLAISGNVSFSFALKAAKRLLGAWKKSEKLVPPTFRQPETPNKELLFIESAGDEIELRSALRSVARNDKAFYATQILAAILHKRAREKASPSYRDKVYVHGKANLLSGSVVSKQSINSMAPMPANSARQENGAITAEQNANRELAIKFLLTDFMAEKVSAEEFEAAKAGLAAEIGNKDILDQWLDADTYKLGSVKEDAANWESLKLADIHLLAENWRKETIASIILSKPSNIQKQQH